MFGEHGILKRLPYFGGDLFCARQTKTNKKNHTATNNNKNNNQAYAVAIADDDLRGGAYVPVSY